MKKLLIALLLLPIVALAQTPTPTATPDPDLDVAEKYSLTLMEVKLMKLTQAIQEARQFEKSIKDGKIGTATEILFDMTQEQKMTLRQSRRTKIQAIKAACRDLSEAL